MSGYFQEIETLTKGKAVAYTRNSLMCNKILKISQKKNFTIVYLNFYRIIQRKCYFWDEQ